MSRFSDLLRQFDPTDDINKAFKSGKDSMPGLDKIAGGMAGGGGMTDAQQVSAIQKQGPEMQLPATGGPEHMTAQTSPSDDLMRDLFRQRMSRNYFQS